MARNPPSTARQPAPAAHAPAPPFPRAKLTSTLIMLAATALMLPLLFPPFYCFFLAPVALVPFVVCIIRRPFNWTHLAAYYLLGCAFFIPNLYWLAPVTLGGTIALALYVAIYFPLFAFGTHRLIIHLRLPATLAVPLVWTAVEFVRCTCLEGGFPWFMLGNCLAPIPTLIQTADLFGVWGVSFLIAMLNGFIVDLLRLPLSSRSADGHPKPTINPLIHRLANTVVVTLILASAYGIFRINQNTTTPGPLIAVLQENIPQEVKDAPNSASMVWTKHLNLTLAALRQEPHLDLLVWPETMVPGYGNSEFLNASPQELRTMDDRVDWRGLQSDSRYYIDFLEKDISTARHVPLLLGVGALVPRGSYSDSIKQNRTLLVLPDRGVVDEYSKVHLVPFGEYMPFGQWPGLKKWLLGLSPYGPDFDFSNTPGTRWTRFVLPVLAAPASSAPSSSAPSDHGPLTTGHSTYTFGTPICFEDVMPDPPRNMVSPALREADGKKADFLINVSNEGWFKTVEFDQHLQATQLRAVENRVPIARSVNTGNSGFIDSNGRIVKLVTDANGRSIHAVGFAIHRLEIDSRHTLYTRIGDLFPILCGIFATLAVGWTLVRPRRGTPRDQ